MAIPLTVQISVLVPQRQLPWSLRNETDNDGGNRNVTK